MIDAEMAGDRDGAASAADRLLQRLFRRHVFLPIGFPSPVTTCHGAGVNVHHGSGNAILREQGAVLRLVLAVERDVARA